MGCITSDWKGPRDMAVHRDMSVDFNTRVDAPHWNGFAAGELRLQRCTECKEWIWPADWRCRYCGSWDLGWEAVPLEGTVYSWVRTHHNFMPAFKDLLPYVTVLIELPQAGGRRVLGLLAGDEQRLRIGARVEGFIEGPSERTQNLHALRWKLVDAAVGQSD